MWVVCHGNMVEFASGLQGENLEQNTSYTKMGEEYEEEKASGGPGRLESGSNHNGLTACRTYRTQTWHRWSDAAG